MKQRTLKKLGAVIGALLVSGALAGTAAAVLTSDSGGAQVKVDKRTDNAPSTTSATNWVNLPGVSVGVFVPANTTRLLRRAVLRRVALQRAGRRHLHRPHHGVRRPGRPGRAESCGRHRLRLRQRHGGRAGRPPGGPRDGAVQAAPGGANGTNYTIQVQFAVSNAQTVFTLDEWHLAVLTNL